MEPAMYVVFQSDKMMSEPLSEAHAMSYAKALQHRGPAEVYKLVQTHYFPPKASNGG